MEVPTNFKRTPEEQLPWGVCVTGMSTWVGETHSEKRYIFSLNALLFLGFLSMLWPSSALACNTKQGCTATFNNRCFRDAKY